MLQSLANSLSSPLVHGLLLFVILQLLSRLPLRGQRIYQWVSYVPILWVFFCSLVYPSVLLIKPLEDQYPTIKLSSNEWQLTDGIVVLACNHFDDDGLPFVSKWPQCTMQRNLHAALMYNEKSLPIYLAAGILNETDSKSQAQYNKDFLVTLGVNPKDIHISLRTAPLKVKQILVNLLGNALKFSESGGTITVLLEAGKEKNASVKISVIDTGIGIPEEKLLSIFEPFGQVDSTTTRRFGGTGLGLPIVKQLVNLMGGSVEVSSQLSIGTEFKMDFAECFQF